MSTFQHYFVDTIKNRYAQFDGRASRSEYWYFTLYYVLILLAVGAVSGLLGYLVGNIGSMIGMAAIVLLILALFIPALAIAIRRLHDSGKSGWFFLLGLIPTIGGIILLVFYCLESQPGTNKYGPNPWEDEADEFAPI